MKLRSMVICLLHSSRQIRPVPRNIRLGPMLSTAAQFPVRLFGSENFKPKDNTVFSSVCRKIQISGPISVAQYMREVLTNPIGVNLYRLSIFASVTREKSEWQQCNTTFAIAHIKKWQNTLYLNYILNHVVSGPMVDMMEFTCFFSRVITLIEIWLAVKEILSHHQSWIKCLERFVAHCKNYLPDRCVV